MMTTPTTEPNAITAFDYWRLPSGGLMDVARHEHRSPDGDGQAMIGVSVTERDDTMRPPTPNSPQLGPQDSLRSSDDGAVTISAMCLAAFRRLSRDSMAVHGGPQMNFESKIRYEGQTILRVSKEIREFLSGIDDPEARSLLQDLDVLDRVGSWLSTCSPIDCRYGIGTAGLGPHVWTPDETKNRCLICGDGVWGRHRFQSADLNVEVSHD